MVGESNYDRSYLMALSAWNTFGHTSEPPKMFAQRIAVIGEAKGISAAAEEIAKDCRQAGLEMSAGRVLKSLGHTLERHRDQLHRLKSIEEFQIDEIGKLPPGVADFLKTASTGSQPSPWGCLIFFVVQVFIGWLIFR